MRLDGEFGYHELERAALAFATETETWPVFLAWCRENAASPEGIAWAADPTPLEEVRGMWLAHGEPALQALAVARVRRWAR